MIVVWGDSRSKEIRVEKKEKWNSVGEPKKNTHYRRLMEKEGWFDWVYEAKKGARGVPSYQERNR